MVFQHSILMAIATVIVGTVLQTNNYILSCKDSSLEILGTSNLHDWSMRATELEGTLAITFEAEKLSHIESMQINIIAESLKSNKREMDKNTYKALQTNKFTSITYHQSSVNRIEEIGENTYHIDALGTLVIAGEEKVINLKFTLITGAEKIIVKGVHELNMKDFGIKPPTAVFGTIKTGKNVVIKFESHFRKKVEQLNTGL